MSFKYNYFFEDEGHFSVNYQGSIICQAILDFHGRSRKHFIDSLLEIETKTLEKIFDSSGGSFLLEKMSRTIPEKKLIEILSKLPLDKVQIKIIILHL